MERNSYASVKKNDSWDARCINAVLIRRHKLLPDANPQDYYWTMQHLVNRRNALVKINSSLLQQFLNRFNMPIPAIRSSLTMWNVQRLYHSMNGIYPSPEYLDKVEIEELAVFLREVSRNSCSTNKATLILELVEQDKVAIRDYQYARDTVIQSIARNVRFHNEEMKRIEQMQAKMLLELNYKLETIPGVGTVTASALVANIGDITHFKSADKLCSYAGVAPVYHGSAGKGKNYQNKNLGNRELYSVLYFLAIQQIYMTNKGEARNEELRAYFEYKVSKGKTKIQALICIMRKLIRIIYSMMKYKTEYKMPEPKEKVAS